MNDSWHKQETNKDVSKKKKYENDCLSHLTHDALNTRTNSRIKVWNKSEGDQFSV
jgi:hypothetical protein